MILSLHKDRNPTPSATINVTVPKKENGITTMIKITYVISTTMIW